RADAALPRLARQEGLPPERLQLAARRGAGGGAAWLPPAVGRLEPRTTRGSVAIRSARPRRGLRAAGRRRRPRVPHVRRPLARARPDCRGADRSRDLLRLLLRDAAPPPAGAALPR